MPSRYCVPVTESLVRRKFWSQDQNFQLHYTCTTNLYHLLACTGSYRQTKIFKMDQYFWQFRSGGTKIFIENFDHRTISAGTVTYVRANSKISPLICILLPTHLSMLNVSVPEWLCTSLVYSTVQNGSLS